MSQPSCYGLDPVYSEEEFQALEQQRREREAEAGRVGEGHDVDAEAAARGAPADPHPGPDRRQHFNWCICGNCVVMPTARECICCREIQGCTDIADGCIVESDDYVNVCLTRVVLRVLHIARRDIRGHARHVPQELSNKASRYASYRAFTYLIHGVLGKGVRKVIPACAVTNIRREFPEASGVYVGFRQGDDGEVLEVPEQFDI